MEWNSIIINFHTNCIIYQTFNRLSEYLCRRRSCSVLSTCATRAGRGVGTMWPIGLFLNLYTDIVRTETAGLPVEIFIQPVIVLINSRMFVYFYVFNSKTLLRLQRYSPGLQCSTPRLLTTFLYNALYNAVKPSLICLLTTRRKVRLLNLHGSVCIFAIFAFNLKVQFRS